jgi:hypothetical protein
MVTFNAGNEQMVMNMGSEAQAAQPLPCAAGNGRAGSKTVFLSFRRSHNFRDCVSKCIDFDQSEFAVEGVRLE